MKHALAAIGSAFAVFVLGGFVEERLIFVLRPSAGRLGWISDLVIASALGVVLYLWLHLRGTRAALLEAERRGIVLNTQLEVAANIQRTSLPAVPAGRHGVSWAVQLAAAGRIGGDYYDFVDVGGTSRIFIIGDISGKGIPAAMMLVFVHAVFREAVHNTSEPREIVGRLNQALLANTGGTPYLTCIVVRVDEDSRRLTMTNAGHPAAVLMGTPSRRLEKGGPPAGLFPDRAYEQDVLDLHAGDRVLFVTDGISECLTEPLDRAVERLNRLTTAQTLCASVFQLSQGAAATPPVAEWEDDRTAAVLAVD